MNYGVLGTGMVGEAIASKLIELDHFVCMGSRTADNPKAVAWRHGSNQNASIGTFADAAAFGEVVINCTAGSASVAVITSIANHLDGKILIDIANPIVHSDAGVTLDPVNTESLAEQLQAAAPKARVVKTLNNLNASVMVDPSRVPGHTLFVSSDDGAAKQQVMQLLHDMGWSDAAVLDLGGLTTARGAEMVLPLWISIMTALGRADFGIQVRV